MSATFKSRMRRGIVLLILGASCNGIGIRLVVVPKEPDHVTSGVFWIIFSVVALIVPGLVLMLAALHLARRRRQRDKIVALANATERLPITVLAADVEDTPEQARDLLLEAIGAGLIVGRLDLEEGVFISGSAHDGVAERKLRCGSCGGLSTVIVTAGSEPQCEYCGFELAVGEPK